MIVIGDLHYWTLLREIARTGDLLNLLDLRLLHPVLVIDRLGLRLLEMTEEHHRRDLQKTAGQHLHARGQSLLVLVIDLRAFHQSLFLSVCHRPSVTGLEYPHPSSESVMLRIQ